MSKANMKGDEKQILGSIRLCWPEFEVTERNVRDLSSEFVTRFFHMYCNDIKKQCAAMFDEELEHLGDIMQHCPAEIERNDFLYVHIKDILDKIGVQHISLIDICIPQNRTRIALKVAMNFLIYAKEQVPHGREVLREIITASKDSEQVAVAKIELKEGISTVSELIGIAKEKIEDIKEEYKKELKIQEDLNAAENDPELNELLREIVALELNEQQQRQELEKLMKEEIDLDNKIVTEDEYNLLKTRLTELTSEVQDIHKATEDVDVIIGQKQKDKNYLQSISTLLTSVDFNSWDLIEKNEKLRKEIEKTENLHNPENLRKHQGTIHLIKKELKELEDILISERKIHEDFCAAHDKKYSQLQMDKEHECELLDKLIKEYTEVRKDYNACKDKCREAETEIEDIIEFNSQMYEQFLNTYSQITTVFNGDVEKLFQQVNEL